MTQFKWQIICLHFLLFCKRNFARQSILTGANAIPKQFPYQVFIDARTDWQWHELCGGTVISNRLILTAARCLLYKWQAYKIYYGAIDKSSNYEKGQRRSIVFPRNTYVHPKWNSSQNIYDIGLIRLPSDLYFNEYVQPASLPAKNQMYGDYNAVVSGWGITAKNYPKMQKLLYLNVTVLSNKECSLLVSKHMPDLVFSPSWICTKPNENYPCQMDTGGPLAIRNGDGTSTVVGLASFGMDKECNRESGRPIIYTRVSSFLNWIQIYSRSSEVTGEETSALVPYSQKEPARTAVSCTDQSYPKGGSGRKKEELLCQLKAEVRFWTALALNLIYRTSLSTGAIRKGRSKSRKGSIWRKDKRGPLHDVPVGESVPGRARSHQVVEGHRDCD